MSLRVSGWTLRGVFKKCQILWFCVCPPPPAPCIRAEKKKVAQGVACNGAEVTRTRSCSSSQGCRVVRVCVRMRVVFVV